MKVKIERREEWNGAMSFRPIQKRYWISRWKPIWYTDVKLPTGANEHYMMDNGHYSWQGNLGNAIKIIEGLWENRKQLKRDREIRRCR